jgi:hypothetical protein
MGKGVEENGKDSSSSEPAPTTPYALNKNQKKNYALILGMEVVSQTLLLAETYYLRFKE